MKQTVLFVRHGRLVPPYDDYDRLSFAELRSLALQTVDPGIEIDRAYLDLNLLKNQTELHLFEAIMISDSKRTSETADIINDKLPVIQTSCLNEILFDLSKLVTEDEFAQNGLVSVREGLFEALLEGKNKESLEQVWQRLKELDGMIRKRGFQSIICVTHGFLMRFVQMYYLHKVRQPGEVTKRGILSAKNLDYLEGVEIELT